jgi:peptidoglycan/xylan/chitin deacetylase (PgdA/CDA1 family)
MINEPIANDKAQSNGRWQTLISDVSHALALERLGPHLAQRILWRVETVERAVALSFDDGPHPEFTPAILELLAEHQLPATFFMIGKYVRRHPKLAQRLASTGHEVGNHTLNHRILPFMSENSIRHEILQTDRIIRETTGYQPKFVRPPMGLFTKRTVDVIEACGYGTVVGDVYPRDPHMPGRHKIHRRVMARVRPGSIIILHDGGNTAHVDRSQTVWAVRHIIQGLLQQGYRFTTISDLAGHAKKAEC